MFQRSTLGSSEENFNAEIFKSFLQALSLENEATLGGFFSSSSPKQLSPPWNSSQETLDFFLSVRKAIRELKLTAEDLLARGNALHFSCLVEGVSRKLRRDVNWQFAGRLRFAEGKIVAGLQYADFFDLFRQLGSFSEPPDELEVQDEFITNPVGRFGLEVRYSDSPSLSCNRVGKIQNVSSSLLRLLGKSREAVVGRLFQDSVYYEDEMKVKELLRPSFSEKQREVRLRLNRQAGGIVWVAVSVVNTNLDLLVFGFREDTRIGELIRFQLEERAKLARDLHDGLSQDAAALWLLLEAGKENWNPKLGKKLVGRMLVELRALIADMRSPVYEGKSLKGALVGLKDRFESEAGLLIDLQVDESFEPDLVIDVVVYRLVQESLSNVKKHAHTKRASVSISLYGKRLIGSIKDNGRGFDVSILERTDRLGIKGMRERCHLYGGHLSVVSSALSGTTVSFELPLKAGDALG